MKSLLVTTDRFTVVSGSADVLLKDTDYIKLMVDTRFRHAFLQSYGENQLLVQRLGFNNGDFYESHDLDIVEVDDNNFRTEVGVIAKLS